MADMEALRRRIRDELDRRDWSPRRASLKAGLSPNVLQQFLSGTTGGMSSDTARAVAQVFDWSEDEVFELAGLKTPTEAGDVLGALRAVLARLPARPAERSALFALAEAVMRAAQAPAFDDAEIERMVDVMFSPIGASVGRPLTPEEQRAVAITNLREYLRRRG